MTNAIVPDFAVAAKIKTERRQRLEAALIASKDGPTKTDLEIAKLALTPGWEHIEDFISEQIEGLHSMVGQAISSGASFQEIGERATLAQLAGEELQTIIDFVKERAKSVGQT